MGAQVHIRLIGPLEVNVGGRRAELPRSRKTRALLAMLALEPWVHPRPVLCAHIWPETADPRADLRWSLSKLRAVLGQDALVGTTEGIRLDAEQVATDVRQLEALLTQAAGPAESGEAGGNSEALESLARDERHFSGMLLADLQISIGVEYELWLESQRQGLLRLQQRMLSLLIEHYQQAPEQALEFARRRVALDPLSEGANGDLLRLTLRVGGRRAAQAVLEQARQRLRDAGLSDADLLAEWRRASHQPGTGSVVEPVPLAEDLLTPPQKPSVAVLPFENLGAEDQTLLAQGLSVDLTSSLARLRGLFVIARGSAARFRLGVHSAQEIGRQLGVRYLVHGSTRQLAGRLRVTVDLVECERGEQFWSEQFERAMDDLFLVQDEIVNAIVSALEPQIEEAERDRARLLPTENLNAWECFHRAMWHIYRFTPKDTAEADRLLRRALEQDPRFARAYAGLSFSAFSRAFLQASEDVERDVSYAVELAEESVSLEPRDAPGYWSLGRALFLSRAHDQAMAAIHRSLLLNPNFAQGHYARGFVGCHAGLPDETGPDLEMAERLSPFDPLLFAMQAARAIRLAVVRRPEEAAAWATKATLAPNAHFHIHAIAAACLQLAGRHEEAARKIRDVQVRRPGYNLRVFERSFPHKRDGDRRVMSEALLAAGLEP
ncbi:MAG TPA: hypothetical protein VF210_20100 [Pseudomonadales bacterium]